MNSQCAFGSDCTGTESPMAGKLCDECRLDTTRDVNALRYDYVDLSQRTVKESRPTDVQIRRKKPGPTEPADVHVLTLCEDIVELVSYWARVMLRRGRLSAQTTGRPGFRLIRSLDVVVPRVDEIAGLDLGEVVTGPAYRYGVDGLLQMRAHHRSARKLLAVTAGRIGLPGQCPDRICRARQLYRMDGSEVVSCGKCHRRWRYEDYQRYVTLKVTRIPIIEATLDHHPDG